MKEELSLKYKTALDNIKSSVQLSDELKTYLDTEEDEDYKALISKFENEIHEVYQQTANSNPLQLEAFEAYLLDEGFEGLYLPKAMGYSVLRGQINDNIKYIRPQTHFKNILNFIINSANFEQIKQRVGQSIQIGFALSSDIWITNIIEGVDNKRVKTFLQSQKLNHYRERQLRNTGLVKYRKQFQSLNFETAYFPESTGDLQQEAASIKNFLTYRAHGDYNNENLIPVLSKFVDNKDLHGSPDFYPIAVLIGLYYKLDSNGQSSLKSAFDHIRANNAQANDLFFDILNDIYSNKSAITIDAEKNLSEVISRTSQDKISKFLDVLDNTNSKGYIHEDAVNGIRDFYYQHEGLSAENEAVRNSILSKLSQFLSNLTVTDYPEYFEINKTYTAYMDIFSNQKFNQEVKDYSLRYIKKCLKHYKDKRSKEYQDIKKFVKSSFLDYGFMTEKQLVELFKTKRKPRK